MKQHLRPYERTFSAQNHHHTAYVPPHPAQLIMSRNSECANYSTGRPLSAHMCTACASRETTHVRRTPRKRQPSQRDRAKAGRAQRLAARRVRTRARAPFRASLPRWRRRMARARRVPMAPVCAACALARGARGEACRRLRGGGRCQSTRARCKCACFAVTRLVIFLDAVVRGAARQCRWALCRALSGVSTGRGCVSAVPGGTGAAKCLRSRLHRARAEPWRTYNARGVFALCSQSRARVHLAPITRAQSDRAANGWPHIPSVCPARARTAIRSRRRCHTAIPYKAMLRAYAPARHSALAARWITKQRLVCAVLLNCLPHCPVVSVQQPSCHPARVIAARLTRHTTYHCKLQAANL